MINEFILHFETHDRRIFWILALCIGAAISLYIYFLSVSVYAVIARKHAETLGARTSAHISELESHYVALDKTIDLALAHERGFSDISAPIYIAHEAPRATLSLREDIAP